MSNYNQKEELKKFREKQAEEKKSADKKKKKKQIILSTVVSASAIFILALAITADVLSSSGFFLRRTVSVESENFKVNNAMMTYFVHANAISYSNSYDDYLDTIGLDISKDLKEQTCYFSDGTWYDYFLEMSLSNVKEMLLYYEASLDSGLSLDSDFTEQCDNFINSIKSGAEAEGISYNVYIEDMYGDGVREKDIRKCLELAYLSTESYEALSANYSYTDEEIDEYFENNKTTLSVVDYIEYTFESTVSDTASTEEKDAEFNKNSELARTLSKAKTPEEFLNTAKLYSPDITLEKMTTEAHPNTLSNTEYELFFFDEETEKGDTLIYTEDGLSYTVYMVTNTMYPNDYVTKNVRHILLNSSSYNSDSEALCAAEKIYEEFQNSDRSIEKFTELCKKYSEDEASVPDGGLYENIIKNEMVDEFDAWCYDDARKPGDCELIKTVYGYHIMYFDSDGALYYRIKTADSMRKESLNKDIEEFKELYKITVYENKLSSINS